MISEIIIARIVLIIFSIVMIIIIIKLKKEQRIGKQVFSIIIIFWFIVLIVAIEPSVLEIVRDSTPLSNNAQFLLILSLIIIFYMLLTQITKGKSTSDNLHHIVRSVSINNFKQNFEESEKTHVLIIMCAKNEEESIGNVIDEIYNLNLPFSYQIVLINDGSTDDTAKIARKKNVYVLDHFYNLGIGAAVKTGFLVSKFFKPQIIINIDADGQHDPKYIPEIVIEIEKNDADLVYASRFADKSRYDSSIVKLVGNKFYTNLVRRITKIPFTDVTTGFRGMKFSKIDKVIFNSETNFSIELALRAARNGLKITEIPTHAKIRKHGKSQFHRLEKFFSYNINVIIQIYNAFLMKPKISNF